MQFYYHQKSGSKNLTIDGQTYKHIFKIRRVDKNQKLNFRNLNDNILYSYQIEDIGKNNATLLLIDTIKTNIKPKPYIHIAWCIIDPKDIYRYIAILNQLSVDKLSFVYCAYSQKNYKIDRDKIEKLLINSCCQCGRIDKMKIEQFDSTRLFLDSYQDSYILNFSSNTILNHKDTIKTILVGCEGGLHKDEINMFKTDKIVGLKNQNILTSQTAVVTVASILSN